MNLVNCTPHALHLMLDGATLVLPPSGEIARVKTTRAKLWDLDCNGVAVPVYTVVYGDLEGLPTRTAGVYFIVSALAAQQAKLIGRDDVLVVDDTVRDAEGKIVGARALAII